MWEKKLTGFWAFSGSLNSNWTNDSKARIKDIASAAKNIGSAAENILKDLDESSKNWEKFWPDENWFYKFYKELKSSKDIISFNNKDPEKNLDFKLRRFIGLMEHDREAIDIIEKLYEAKELFGLQDLEVKKIIFFILLEIFWKWEKFTCEDFENYKYEMWKWSENNTSNVPAIIKEFYEHKNYLDDKMPTFSMKKSAEMLWIKDIDEDTIRELNTILPFLKKDL